MTLKKAKIENEISSTIIVIICLIGPIGVIIGMLCSPRKSITAGCGNGPTTINNLGTEEEDDDQVEEDA